MRPEKPVSTVPVKVKAERPEPKPAELIHVRAISTAGLREHLTGVEDGREQTA